MHLLVKLPRKKERSKLSFCWQSGLFPRLGEYSNVCSESGNLKGKTTHLGICDNRSIWLQVLGFPHARPRMYRLEVGVAACILIEAHSHTLSSFQVRRIKHETRNLRGKRFKRFGCVGGTSYREGPPGWAEHPLRTSGFEIKLN